MPVDNHIFVCYNPDYVDKYTKLTALVNNRMRKAGMGNKPSVDFEELKRGGLVKLKEKDLFSLWVKTSCCNLNSAQLIKLAEIAEKYARGFLLFTSRQIPIIPFVNIKDVDEVKRELDKVYLELDRCGPRVRNINVCYEDKICPEAVTNSISLGEKLDKYFCDPILHKIKIGVSGCEKDCTISRVLNDISFIGTERSGVKCYDAYVGGRLGVNPFVGVKMGENISEDEAVRLVQNYFDLLRASGKTGERAADIIVRLGEDVVKQKLNKDLRQKMLIEPVRCESRQGKISKDKNILRIKATCGEVTSKQLVTIADIADRYGEGFVHFAVRGSPEIPGISQKDLRSIRAELQEAGLQVLEKGIDNFQSCFGNYCIESLSDPQALLRRIEKKVEELDLNNRNITISASGCPNSCGIAHLSDIGFHGAVEPEIDANNCNGCGLCLAVCKKKAIEVNNVATIDKEKCRHCGACTAICPANAIVVKRQGFTVLVGFRGGEQTQLGQVFAEFLTEEEAFNLAESYLRLVKSTNYSAADIIDDMGIKKFRASLIVRQTGLVEKQS